MGTAHVEVLCHPPRERPAGSNRAKLGGSLRSFLKRKEEVPDDDGYDAHVVVTLHHRSLLNLTLDKRRRAPDQRRARDDGPEIRRLA